MSVGNWTLEPILRRDKWQARDVRFTLRVFKMVRAKGGGSRPPQQVQIKGDVHFTRKLMPGQAHSLDFGDVQPPKSVRNNEPLPTFAVKCLDRLGNFTAAGPDEEEWVFEVGPGPFKTEHEMKAGKVPTKVKGLTANLTEKIPLGGLPVEQSIVLKQPGKPTLRLELGLFIRVLPSKIPTKLTVDCSLSLSLTLSLTRSLSL